MIKYIGIKCHTQKQKRFQSDCYLFSKILMNPCTQTHDKKIHPEEMYELAPKICVEATSKVLKYAYRTQNGALISKTFYYLCFVIIFVIIH